MGGGNRSRTPVFPHAVMHLVYRSWVLQQSKRDAESERERERAESEQRASRGVADPLLSEWRAH